MRMYFYPVNFILKYTIKLKRLSHLLKSISKSGDFQFHWDALKASYEASDDNISNPKSPSRQFHDQFTQTDQQDQSENQSNLSQFIPGNIKIIYYLY